MSAQPISFGDRVRIRSQPVTDELGLGNAVGIIHGFTTPSVTGVTVIGHAKGDYALNVFFENRNEGFWFDPALVEFVDHAPGSEMTVGDKKWIRSAGGDWDRQ